MASTAAPHQQPGEEPALPVLDAVADYEKLHRLGEGTYGVVYKARDRRTGEIVALKKVRFDRARDGVPVTSVRELRVLQECGHPNIVSLKRVVTGPKADSIFLVFEYCDHDLGRLVDALPRPFSVSEVKCLMLQLLRAVSFLHDRWVVHRDLKLSNLLYTSGGVLKLCDFGLARYFAPDVAQMTPKVVTLWYRAPELLLGASEYDERVDCWALGCILAELLRHQPLFPAKGELDCLNMMFGILGPPTAATWPGMAELPLAAQIALPPPPPPGQPSTTAAALKAHFPGLSDLGLQLLGGLLTYDPERRLTAHAALQHPWFREKPFPRDSHDMPTFPSELSQMRHGGGGGAAAAAAASAGQLGVAGGVDGAPAHRRGPLAGAVGAAAAAAVAERGTQSVLGANGGGGGGRGGYGRGSHHHGGGGGGRHSHHHHHGGGGDRKRHHHRDREGGGGEGRGEIKRQMIMLRKGPQLENRFGDGNQYFWRG